VSKLDYPLFHLTFEVFTMLGAFLIYTVSNLSLKLHSNNFISIIGPGMFVVSLITFLHGVTYKGMNLLTSVGGTNLPTQLWLVINYVLAVSLLVALLMHNRKINIYVLTAIYLTVGGFLTILCFAGLFPTAYIEGKGLTPFKVASEYFFIATYVFDLVYIYRTKRFLNRNFNNNLMISISLLVLSGLFFTVYSDVYGITNFIGHYLRLISFFVLYMAIVVESIQRPFNTIFKELSDLSVTDGLTNLFNSRYLVDSLKKYIGANFNRKEFYLLMFDIDGFKAINDQYGHTIGDQVLVEIGEIMKMNTRPGDIVARQGGDEFSVLFYDITHENARNLSDRLHRAILETPLTDRMIHVTISGGLKKHEDENVYELMRATDQLLYHAKELGKNQICT
jgi:diguanylate cyclase (GGDEF)-like protein